MVWSNGEGVNGDDVKSMDMEVIYVGGIESGSPAFSLLVIALGSTRDNMLMHTARRGANLLHIHVLM